MAQEQECVVIPGWSHTLYGENNDPLAKLALVYKTGSIIKFLTIGLVVGQQVKLVSEFWVHDLDGIFLGLQELLDFLARNPYCIFSPIEAVTSHQLAKAVLDWRNALKENSQSLIPPHAQLCTVD